MHIINIGTSIQNSSEFRITNSDFFSDITFIDAEIILWNHNLLDKEFSVHPLLSKPLKIESLSTYKHLIEKRKSEFDEFFEMGRSLIITPPYFHKPKFYIEGSNKAEFLDFMDCLEIKAPTLENVHGYNIQAIKEPFVEHFVSNNYGNFFYESKLINSSGEPLMFIKDTNYVVSEFYRIKNGLLLVLPSLSLNINYDDFLNSLIYLIKKLKEYNLPNKNIIPSWTNNYILHGEEDLRNLDMKIKDKIVQLKKDLEQNDLKLKEFKLLKALFASDGDTLVKSVQFVLKDVGFDIENPNAEKEDLRIRYKDKIAVIEIKGVKGSAAEKNSTQLQKWVSNYHYENDINPKGILIVNTYKNHSLEDRKGEDFPNQMLPYAKQMRHCLVTGLQLLYMYLDYKKGNLNINKIADFLFKTVGVLNYDENSTKLLKINN